MDLGPCKDGPARMHEALQGWPCKDARGPARMVLQGWPCKDGPARMQEALNFPAKQVLHRSIHGLGLR
eukprot:1159042-Pelagomonas_calceolata.AAC.2